MICAPKESAPVRRVEGAERHEYAIPGNPARRGLEPVEYCAQSLRVQMSAVLVVAVPGRRSLLSGSAGVLLEDVVGVRRVGEGDVVLPSRSLLKRMPSAVASTCRSLRPMRM